MARAAALGLRPLWMRCSAPRSEKATIMSSISFGTLSVRRWHWPALRLTRGDVLRYTGLAFIVALAVWLRFANLGAIGQSNTYYTAAVKSMLQSWHNFFFVAAE